MDGNELEPTATEAVVSAAPSRAAFAFIFVTVLLDMLALGIMVPVLPKLVVQFEGGDVARAAGITGVFGFTWAAMQFVFSPLTGALSDRFGRRPVVLASNLGLGLDYLVMAVAPSLGWLFLGRVISGITAASFSTAGAYIADVTPPEQRASKFGMLGAAFGLGFIVGPAVGGTLGQIDLRLPFWVAGVLSLANATYGFLILPESLPKERRRPFDLGKANPLGSIALFRSTPGLLGLAGTIVLYFLAHESLPSVFVLDTTYRYGWGERDTGLVLALVGVGSTVVSAALVGPAVRKLGERATLLLGLACGVASFGVYGVATSGAMFLWGLPFGALWGLTGPAAQALMSRRIGPTEQGRLQGALSSLRGITGMVGPLLFTQVLSAAVGGGVKAALPGAPFLVAAALLGASFFAGARATAEQS